MEAGVADKVNGRTLRGVLNTAGYHYCRSRKKGLSRVADLNARLDFCKNIRKSRGGSRAAARSKMEHFVIIVNGFQPRSKFLE